MFLAEENFSQVRINGEQRFRINGEQRIYTFIKNRSVFQRKPKSKLFTIQKLLVNGNDDVKSVKMISSERRETLQ